jgi:DNA repair ATPase RecN
MKTTKELIIADITAKVEAKLASQKVELSVVEDFKKEYDKALDLQLKAETAIVDYNELGAKILSGLNLAGQSFLKANARFQEIEQLSKELGVEPSQPLKNNKEIISKAIKEIDTYVKKLSSNKVNI